MLGNSRIHPVLLATDLAQAREFYHDKIGLEIIVEDDDRIELDSGQPDPDRLGRSTTFARSSTSFARAA